MPKKKVHGESPTPRTRQRPRRASGRPSSESAVGRDAIRDTAVELLKAKSHEQLTILEIATAAGVTRALVRYYFGDLRGLLREVAEHLVLELQDRMGQDRRARGTIADQIYHRLVLRLEFMREHPHFERLALSEIYRAADAAVVEEGSPLHRITDRGMELTRSLFGGSVGKAAPDPRFVHLAIVSVSGFLTMARPLLTELFGADRRVDKEVDAYLRFMAGTLARSIEESASSGNTASARRSRAA